MSRLVIVGAPRSGTTWTGRVLGHTDGTAYVNEPDGFRDPFAFRVMLRLGENPDLGVDDAAPDYERLWRGALAGGRPARTVRARLARTLYERTSLDEIRAARARRRASGRLRVVTALAQPRVADPAARHVVVKSVQSTLSIEWVWSRFRPRVLVVERNPLNVLASWIDLDFVRQPQGSSAVGDVARRRWGIEPPGEAESRLVHQAFHYGVLASALREAASRHPEWLVVTHEHLCEDSAARFRVLAADLGLDWGDRAEAFLAESNREGRGFRTNRRAEDLPDRWRERLDAEQVATIRATLARFPFALVPEP